MQSTLRIFLVLICCGLLAGPAPAASAQAPVALANLVYNPGFEWGTDLPDGWATDFSGGVPPNFSWDTQAYLGTRSVKIDAVEPVDSRFMQVVNVQPNTLYRVSGYIKTENVAHSPQSVDTGATLSLMGTWDQHTRPLLGTNDWTYVSFAFNSGDSTQVTLTCRLGFWSGVTTGTAWFDDVEIAPILPTDPTPSWKILVLIYQRLDATVIDSSGIEHHFTSERSQDEMERAGQAVTHFVTEDIPALNSGYMIPTVTVRFPERALDTLSPYFDRWWVSLADVAPEYDPNFDSLIVVWDPWVIDQNSGVFSFIGGAAGLTPDMRTGQTFNSIVLDSAIRYGHLTSSNTNGDTASPPFLMPTALRPNRR
jgi:hypothetical protein